jgi:sulfur carrier protein
VLIYVNSKEQTVPERSTVADLIAQLQLTQKRVAVEVNAELVTKAEWNQFEIKAGDRIEIVSFVGGG